MRGYLFQRLHGTKRNMKEHEAIFLNSHDYTHWNEISTQSKISFKPYALELNVASDLRKTGNSLWDKVDMFNITNMLNPESATES